MALTKGTYIITGASGFVGKALLTSLVQKGCEVIAIARRSHEELLRLGAVKVYAIDLARDSFNPDDFVGVLGVFHTAAKVEMWGSYQSFFQTNVVGTQKVIDLCLQAGIENLVFTSSPSVIADGRNLRGVDEGYPYPESYKAYYPATKAIAEKMVLAEGQKRNSLKTVALRPHLIWGKGDTNLTPTVIEKAERGKLMRIGRGDNLVDLTLIDDCVAAHLLAMEALQSDAPGINGEVFFISQGDPVKLWWWIDQVLERNGIAAINRSLPYWAAYALAAGFEIGAKVLKREPLLTRFLVSEMATDHYFNIQKARQRLGFVPKFSIKDGLNRAF
ncbi:MAG TPA: NAD-dependent epimerase/dehydratase family protein [Oligoflexia bacterium]|nr:NAD-dependent epimerase/dehydratase family protein [Oligoflexia bacterium]HMP27455.1 NAD-dependent epimerase/dehydratase family protein [Oligoflexia bacterium]